MEFKIEHFEEFVRISCNPEKVCPQFLSVDVDKSLIVKDMGYVGGCDGNLSAIRKLIVDQGAIRVAELLSGNICGSKSTSCAGAISCLICKAIEVLNEKYEYGLVVSYEER